MTVHATKLRFGEVGSQPTCEQIVRVQHRRADWRVCRDWQDLLVGPDAPDWFALQDDPRGVCVKVGHARETWRVTIDDRVVFAKVAGDAGFVGRLKRWAFGHSPSLTVRRLVGLATSAEREWHALREAERRGVRAVRCLAAGVRYVSPTAKAVGSPWQTALLSEGLTDTVSLTDAWERSVERGLAPGLGDGEHKSPNGSCPPDVYSRAARRVGGVSLVSAVARLFALAHECGFVHGDAHPNNILMQTSPTGEREAFYVDVHSARLGRRWASPRRSLYSLAQLDQYFQRRATRTDRLRFFHQYLALRPSMSESLRRRSVRRKLLAALMRAKASHGARLARERDRRLRRDGPYFKTLSLGGGWRARVVLRLERRHVFPEPDVPDRAEADWRAILDPLVETVAGTCSAGVSFDHQGLRVEMSRTRGLLARIAATLRGSPQRRAFDRCHKQRHRDIRNELTVAVVEHRRGGLMDATMLIRAKCVREPRGLPHAVLQAQLV